MKHFYFPTFFLLMISSISFSQGWVGTGNIIYGVNSNQALTPLNVGIGTLSPTAQLHTTATVRFQGLTTNNTFTRVIVADANGNLFTRDASTLGAGNAWLLTGNAGTNPATNFLGTTDNTRMVFRTNNVEQMTILNTSGNVGIGTTSPNHKITIQSGVVNDGIYIINEATNSNGGEIGFHDNTHFNVTNGRTTYATISAPNYGICWPNTPGTGQGAAEAWIAGLDGVSLFTNQLERLRITRAGNVGIGIANPTVSLDVNGAVRATQYITLSDKRFKKNITKIRNASELISSLVGAEYELNGAVLKNYSFQKGKTFGFIAQDFQKVLPELVFEDNEGYLGINYIGVIPLLVEAFKQKSEEVKDLQARLTKLEEYIYSNKRTFSDAGDITLSQNVPNPFQASTIIHYTIDQPGNVVINLYNSKGVKLKTLENSTKQAGDYTLSIDGVNLTSGVYFYTLNLNNQKLVKKAIKL